MSENFKRAESLFNRIMNQNKSGSDQGGRSKSSSSDRHNNGSSNGHHHRHRLYKGGHSNYGGSSSGAGNSQSHHSSRDAAVPVPAASFDLPKRDPVKEAQDAVAQLVGTQHVLPYCWTIWHHSRSKTKAPAAEDSEEVEKSGFPAAAVDSYLQTATEIEFPCYGNPAKTVRSIASLEQMWVGMSLVKRSHELSNGSELLVFKTGVNPVWEDPINTKGGRWVFRFNHRANAAAGGQDLQDGIRRGRKRATLIWERLVLKTLTGLLLPCKKEMQDLLLSDIVGLVLSVRRDEEIISVWNSNTHFSKKRDDDKKGVTAFHARRVYCDTVLRVIREVDMILQGSDSIDTQATSSNERVSGVTFEYRLHSDSSHTYGDRGRRGKTYHHRQPREEEEER